MLANREERKEFAEEVNSTMAKMKEVYKTLEAWSPKIDELAKGRQEYEEQEKLCVCVSDRLEDMSEFIGVLMHLMQTYGSSILDLAERVVAHEDNSVRRDKVREILEGILKPVMEREPKDGDKKPN